MMLLLPSRDGPHHEMFDEKIPIRYRQFEFHCRFSRRHEIRRLLYNMTEIIVFY